MWPCRINLIAAVFTAALCAQTPPDTAPEQHVRAASIDQQRKKLTGRTDPAAIAEWQNVLTAMRLANDPDLKSAVQSLRGLNLYDSEAWINLVNLGYAYLGEETAARQFRNELAHRLPDSNWAIQAAIQQWESTHKPHNATEDGLHEWQLARMRFLRRLHEQRPRSETALRDILGAALWLQSRLSTDEALAIADLALEARSSLPFDPGFDVVQIYLDHRQRLDDIPRLLSETVERAQSDFRSHLTNAKQAEAANRQLARAQFQMHIELAGYWLQKQDGEQARSAMRDAAGDLTRLAHIAEGRSEDWQHVAEAYRQLWSNMAKRVGLESETPAVHVRELDWANAPRAALGDFEATDFEGRRWTLRDWKGKVVLVNIWATWCSPCRAELPYVQKLHDALRGRRDRLVISINVDSDAGLARRLVHERGYRFPVLNSQRLADRFDFTRGVPQNRIMDATGRLLLEPVEGTGDEWVAKVKAAMDDLSPGRAPAARAPR